MTTQITYKGRKYHFLFKVMLFTILLFSSRSFGQFENFKPTVMFFDDWVAPNWQNQSKIINTYSSQGFLTNTLSQSWNTTVLDYVDSARIIYTNNASGMPTLALYQSWDIPTSTWVNFARVTTNYNAAGKPLVSTYETWFDPVWQPYTKETNTYGANGFLTNSLTQTRDFTNPLQVIFVNSSQILYANNANGTVNIAVRQKWNPGTNAWDNFQRETFTYSGTNILTATTEEWNGTAYVNFAKDTNTYNSSGYLVNELHQLWDTASGTWKNDSQTLITNNASGIPTELIEQDWTLQNTWVNDSRIRLLYGPLAVDDFVSAKNFALYPVPAYDNITIKTNDDLEGLNYNIIDETGRVFTSGRLDREETNVDINHLASGIYFFQFGHKRNQTVKVIKR